jgi:hypothetical protein
MPTGIADRDADVWEALFSVADAAGEPWASRARVSGVTHVTDSKAAIPSLGVRLLADLRTIFGIRDHMPTHEILAALNGMDEAPWGDIHGKPLDARGLSRRLSRYGVEPGTVRTGDGTSKGYSRADLDDPWRRYVTGNVTQCRIHRVGETGGQREETQLPIPLGVPAMESVTSGTGTDRLRSLADLNERHQG